MANQQKKKNKSAPSSAGQHCEKYKGFFTEVANRRYFEKKLRTVLHRNGEKAARTFAAKHAKFSLERTLEALLAEQKKASPSPAIGKTDRSSDRPMASTPAPIGPGAAGRDLPPFAFSLAEKFAEAGITPDKFPEKRKTRRRKSAVKRLEVISPNMSLIEPDLKAPIKKVLGSLLS